MTRTVPGSTAHDTNSSQQHGIWHEEFTSAPHMTRTVYLSSWYRAIMSTVQTKFIQKNRRRQLAAAHAACGTNSSRQHSAWHKQYTAAQHMTQTVHDSTTQKQCMTHSTWHKQLLQFTAATAQGQFTAAQDRRCKLRILELLRKCHAYVTRSFRKVHAVVIYKSAPIDFILAPLPRPFHSPAQVYIITAGLKSEPARALDQPNIYISIFSFSLVPGAPPTLTLPSTVWFMVGSRPSSHDCHYSVRISWSFPPDSSENTEHYWHNDI